MTVSNTTAVSPAYVGNGVTTAFAFSFDIGAEDELIVVADGEIADSDDYAVTLNAGGNGGTVTFASAPTADEIYIVSDPDFAQDISFTNAGAFLPETHDEANDRHARKAIALKAKVDRALVVPLGETGATFPPFEAGKFLATLPGGNFGYSAGTTDDDILRIELADDTGAALVGFVGSGVTPSARTVQDKLRERLSTADKTGAFLAQLEAIGTDLAAGGRAFIPRGTHTLSATFLFAGQRLNLEGEGRQVSIISFNPASADVALELNTAGAGGQYQSRIAGLGFTSANSNDKTAILIDNVGNVDIEDIGIASGGWAGTGSIGINTKGRQFNYIRRCEISCARPIVIGANNDWPTLAGDHSTIDGCELFTTAAAGTTVEIEDGAVVSNFTIRNCAIMGGKYGVRLNDTTATGIYSALKFENIRTEQGTDGTGWSFDLGSTAQSIQSISFENIRLDASRNGIRLRNCQRIKLDSVEIAQTGGKVALDITFVAGTVLTIIGGWNQSGGTVTLTNAKKVFGVAPTEGGFGPLEIWVYDTGLAKDSALYRDKPMSGTQMTVADSASVPICDDSFAGYVRFTTNEDVGATFYLRGGTHTVSERDDPDGFFNVAVNNPTTYNVYWDAGTSTYRLQNKRGATKTVSWLLDGIVGF